MIIKKRGVKSCYAFARERQHDISASMRVYGVNEGGSVQCFKSFLYVWRKSWPKEPKRYMGGIKFVARGVGGALQEIFAGATKAACIRRGWLKARSAWRKKNIVKAEGEKLMKALRRLAKSYISAEISGMAT